MQRKQEGRDQEDREQEEKERLSKKCRTILKESGIDPDDIWSTKFSIDDFISLGCVSVEEVNQLLVKIKENPRSVVRTLAKGLESGIMFDWDTVAETALNEVLRD